jgi:hypothetical protein
MQKHKAGKPGVCKHDGRGPAVYRLDYKESVSRKHERDCRNMVFAGTDMIDGNIVCAETNTITGKLYCDKKRRFEEGSASILEYTIVLPLCMLVVSAMIFLGLYLCRYAILDSAADRAVLIIRKMYADANYLEIADPGLGEGDADHLGIKARRELYGLCGCEPYRFLAGAYNREHAMRCVEGKLRIILGSAAFPGMVPDLSGTDISIVEKTGLFGKEAVITVRQEIMLPGILGKLAGKPLAVMQVTSAALLSCPQEMIRNTDFVLDITESFTGIDVRDKIGSVLSRAGSFLSGG